MEDSKLLEQQLTYYRKRAPEYDEWFLRQGRYDRGAQHRSEWFREVSLIETKLRRLVRGKDVLELAAGTGLWTERLADVTKRIVAVDGSPEAIGINRNRLRGSEASLHTRLLSRGYARGICPRAEAEGIRPSGTHRTEALPFLRLPRGPGSSHSA